MGDKERGLYKKFIVKRTDGADRPGCEHEHDEYFVLNISSDPYALEALNAYLMAVDTDGHAKFASELAELLQRGREAQIK